ncbi:MAG: PcfJ domain-containing protein [Bacteroidia bacterium]|nr:PcfJ domain-containing protein [Bacteroidia bacterium]
MRNQFKKSFKRIVRFVWTLAWLLAYAAVCFTLFVGMAMALIVWLMDPVERIYILNIGFLTSIGLYNLKETMERKMYDLKIFKGNSGDSRPSDIGDKEYETLEPFLSRAIRPMKKWKRNYENDPKIPIRLDLMRHLFVKKHKVPPFFENTLQWYMKKEDIERFVFIAEGHDLKNLPGLPYPLSRKMLSILGKTREVSDFNNAVFMAEIKGLGGTDQLFWAIQVSDVSSEISKPGRNEFWRTVWTYLILQKPQSEWVLNHVLTYVNALKFGSRMRGVDNEWLTDYHPPLQPNFCIKGRNFEKLKSEAEVWYRRTQGLADNTLPNWAEGITRFSVEHEGLLYEILPLKTREEILIEGSEMNHCVGEYVADCINGFTSIWSMTVKEPKGHPQKVLTLELNSDLVLVEALGYENREATDQELEIISLWRLENELGIMLNE